MTSRYEYDPHARNQHLAPVPIGFSEEVHPLHRAFPSASAIEEIKMVVALVGRRVDAPDAKVARFPAENIAVVRARIRELFERYRAKVLISSAACGVDLLALEEAGLLGMRRRIILPFERQRFRETSVTDRPGDWGALYDRIVNEVEEQEDVVTLSFDSNDVNAYLADNKAILHEAAALGRELQLDKTAALVWDGSPRGGDDFTKAFGDEARADGFALLEVNTM